MRLAVLMSTYNGAQYLCEQLDSILAQKTDFIVDIWVRDDGSTDETCQILQRYSDEGKLRWYSGENLRSDGSFMDLLLHCRTVYDYYAFADQDDYWLPEKLASGVQKLKTVSGPGFSFANATLVDSELNSLGRNVYRKSPALDLPTLSVAGGILGCTMIINSQLADILREQPLPKQMVMHDFYVALVCLLSGGKVRYDKEPRMYYRQHGSNVQAKTVLEAYPQLGDEKDRAWLGKLADGSFRSRLSVALSLKTRYTTKNQSLTLRLAMLFGNR